MKTKDRQEVIDQWKELGRPILNPDITDLGEVFGKFVTYNFENGHRPNTLGYVTSDFDSDKLAIGNRLTVRDQRDDSYTSYSVEAINPTILASIQENMVPIQNDRTYFNLIIYKDGTGLLSIQYNTIIGSRRLAYLDNTTIPKESLV